MPIIFQQSIDFSPLYCLVCNAPASEFHFGALVCRACSAFFRRRVLSKQNVDCSFNNNCEITNQRDEPQCKSCRMRKCLDVGMQIKYVQSRRDKHDNSRMLERRKASPSTSPDMLNIQWCYESVNFEPIIVSSALQQPAIVEFNYLSSRLHDLHTNFGEMLKMRKCTFPRNKLPRSLHLAEALNIFRTDVRFVAFWILSTFPELKLLTRDQQSILFRNFYLKFTIFEPAFLAILLGKPKTYHLPTGDTVDEVSRYYTRHLSPPPRVNLDEVSKLFNPFWADFRTTLVDPVIEQNLNIHEFLLMCGIVLWDHGLMGQNEKSVQLSNVMRQELYQELSVVCKISRNSEDPIYRFTQLMLLLPAIQRGIDVFEEELHLGGLYRFLVTNNDDWYQMVNGPI